MKKYIKLISIMLITCLLLTGCGKKDSLSRDDFCSLIGDEGYDCFTVDDEYENVSEAAYAMNDDIATEIEVYYMSFKTEEDASNYYAEARDDLLASDDIKYNKEDKNSNYAKLEILENGTYHVISRIGSTFVFTDVDGGYQKQVSELLEKLGY